MEKSQIKWQVGTVFLKHHSQSEVRPCQIEVGYNMKFRVIFYSNLCENTWYDNFEFLVIYFLIWPVFMFVYLEYTFVISHFARPRKINMTITSWKKQPTHFWLLAVTLHSIKAMLNGWWHLWLIDVFQRQIKNFMKDLTKSV